MSTTTRRRPRRLALAGGVAAAATLLALAGCVPSDPDTAAPTSQAAIQPAAAAGVPAAAECADATASYDPVPVSVNGTSSTSMMPSRSVSCQPIIAIVYLSRT